MFSDNHYGLYLHHCSNSIIKRNNFIDNTARGSQAYDCYNAGIKNTFSHNYWNDIAIIDHDKDGIIDASYPIISVKYDESNTDPYPVTTLYNIISIPTIIYPTGGEFIKGTIQISWESVKNIFNEQIYYYIFYSQDNGTNWSILASRLTSTSYDWDTTAVPNGDYLLKIKAGYNSRSWQNAISEQTFTIHNVQSSSSIIGFPLAIVIFSISIVYVNRKNLNGLN